MPSFSVKRVSLLATVIVSTAATAAFFERNALAACGAKDCNTTANCERGCTGRRSVSGVSPNEVVTWICSKVVSVTPSGKKCGDAEQDTGCKDDKSVLCGIYKAKTCAENSINCDNPTTVDDEYMMGCAVAASP